MARSPLSVCGLLACVLLASPAAAQFGSIFRDEPPRPPADVPGGVQDQRYPQDPRYMPPSQQSYPNRPQRAPDQPPERPLPAPMNLPPSSRPGVGGIESAPLAPLPGTQVAPQPPPGAPPPPPFQPGRQRQAPPQPADTAPQPGDQITVEPPPQRIANPTAVFSGLDKVTGRIISFDVAIDETVQFGALQVTPRVCYSRPPTENQNTDTFVEVDEVTLQGEIKRIFTGWMFAASPGLHAVEHPVYDVWLTECKGGKNPNVADLPPDAPKPAATRPPARQQQPRQPARPAPPPGFPPR